MSDPISTKRQFIDDLDRQLVNLLDQRAKLVLELGSRKSEDQMPTFIPSREAEVLDGLKKLGAGDFPRESLPAIFREVISACRRLQNPEKIGVLGEKYGWVHDSARRQFGGATPLSTYEHAEEILRVLGRGDIKEAFFTLDAGDPDLPMLLETLMSKKFSVIGESVARRSFSLASRGATELTGLEEIYITRDTLSRLRRWAASLSFPVRITICRSMEEVVENLIDGRKVAGIIPQGLAKDQNFTLLQDGLAPAEEFPVRCLTISSRPPAIAAAHAVKAKASILASATPQPGGLLRILETVREAGLDLLGVETFAFTGKPFKSLFWIDFTVPAKAEALEPVLSILEARSQFMAFLGVYPVL